VHPEAGPAALIRLGRCAEAESLQIRSMATPGGRSDPQCWAQLGWTLYKLGRRGRLADVLDLGASRGPHAGLVAEAFLQAAGLRGGSRGALSGLGRARLQKAVERAAQVWPEMGRLVGGARWNVC
jgi:hypothetical protein